MSVNIGGLIFVMGFYLAIVLVRVITACRKNKAAKQEPEEAEAQLSENPFEETRSRSVVSSHDSLERDKESMLLEGNINGVIESFTMTATWIGGGFVVGTAEAIYDTNIELVCTQVPWGYVLSLVLGGLVFGRIMEKRGYQTMLDPMEERYGRVMSGVLYIPALMGELCNTASTLAALGTTVAVILDIPVTYSVLLSTTFAVMYTPLDRYFSLQDSDDIQIFCLFTGLWFCIPFVLLSKHVHDIDEKINEWMTRLDVKYLGVWADNALLLCFGGIPWQAYSQKILSARTPKYATCFSFIAAGGCVLLAIPPLLIGTAGRSVEDWRVLGYHYKRLEEVQESRLILALTMISLPPIIVSWISVGAVSAAVMSAADSSLLSASSMFTKDIYKQIFRPKASSRELIISMKMALLAAAVIASAMAIVVKSVFQLWMLCFEMVYVILFPNLVGCLFFEWTNTYGSLCSYLTGLFFRLGGGVTIFHVAPLIHYPGYTEEDGQLFPFKTFSMLVCLLTLVTVSQLSEWVFGSLKVPLKYDVFKCFTPSSTSRTKSSLKLNLDVDRGISADLTRIRKTQSTSPTETSSNVDVDNGTTADLTGITRTPLNRKWTRKLSNSF